MKRSTLRLKDFIQISAFPLLNLWIKGFSLFFVSVLEKLRIVTSLIRVITVRVSCDRVIYSI